MSCAGLRLELEPSVVGEQHLDPDVNVRALDKIGTVLLRGPALYPTPMRAGIPSARTMTAIAVE